MINTMKYNKDLLKSGLSKEQAETIIEAQFQMISENVATKADLNNLKVELNSFKTQMESEFKCVKSDIVNLDRKFDYKFESLQTEVKSLESKLTIKLFGLMALLLGLSAGINRLFQL